MGGRPLIIGSLDELEEEEHEDGSEDGYDSEAVVLGEEAQLELLRERVQLLELLNAAMELEQARLEQRRLELTMLLSQRRLYQEIIEMQSEVAGLVGLTARPSPTARNGRVSPNRRNPEGTGGASSSSEQSRQSQESRARVSASMQEPARLRTNESRASSHSLETRARSSAGEGDLHNLLCLTRRSVDTVASSISNAISSTVHRSSRGSTATAEPEGQSRARNNSRSSSMVQRGLTAAESLRRRGSAGGVANSPAASTASGRGSNIFRVSRNS